MSKIKEILSQIKSLTELLDKTDLTLEPIDDEYWENKRRLAQLYEQAGDWYREDEQFLLAVEMYCLGYETAPLQSLEKKLNISLESKESFNLPPILNRSEDPDVLLWQGLQCQAGIGIPVNFLVAAECFKLSSLWGNRRAQVLWGNLYRQGEGVEQSYAMAVNYCYKPAAEAGYPLAQALYGRDIWYQDRNAAVEFSGKAARSGNAEGQFQLYEIYYAIGEHSTEAEICLRRAALQGHPIAQEALAKSSPLKALELYRRVNSPERVSVLEKIDLTPRHAKLYREALRINQFIVLNLLAVGNRQFPDDINYQYHLFLTKMEIEACWNSENLDLAALFLRFPEPIFKLITEDDLLPLEYRRDLLNHLQQLAIKNHLSISEEISIWMVNHPGTNNQPTGSVSLRLLTQIEFVKNQLEKTDPSLNKVDAQYWKDKNELAQLYELAGDQCLAKNQPRLAVEMYFHGFEIVSTRSLMQKLNLDFDDRAGFSLPPIISNAQDSENLFWQGLQFQAGIGVPVNLKAAAHCFRLLTPEHARANYCLGRLYWKGKGLKQSIKKALRCLQLAEAAEYPKAESTYGFYLENHRMRPDIEKVISCYRKSARKGEAEGQYLLGLVYLEGHEQLEKNEEKAYFWLRRAAMQGLVAAQQELADLCFARVDLNGAVKWGRQELDNENRKNFLNNIYKLPYAPLDSSQVKSYRKELRLNVESANEMLSRCTQAFPWDVVVQYHCTLAKMETESSRWEVSLRLQMLLLNYPQETLNLIENDDLLPDEYRCEVLKHLSIFAEEKKLDISNQIALSMGNYYLLLLPKHAKNPDKHQKTAELALSHFKKVSSNSEAYSEAADAIVLLRCFLEDGDFTILTQEHFHAFGKKSLVETWVKDAEQIRFLILLLEYVERLCLKNHVRDKHEDVRELPASEIIAELNGFVVNPQDPLFELQKVARVKWGDVGMWRHPERSEGSPIAETVVRPGDSTLRSE